MWELYGMFSKSQLRLFLTEAEQISSGSGYEVVIRSGKAGMLSAVQAIRERANLGLKHGSRN